MADSSNPSSNDVTTLSLKPGDKIDAFTVLDTIASTGSAVVYKAHDELLDRLVAIKQIILGNGDTDTALRKRIRDEASLHKRVSTSQPKHLIQFIDAVDDPRGLMLVSEYYPSTSLEDMLHKADAPLDDRHALGIVAAPAKGLDAIHHAGVIHRDLKPSNILLGDDGGLKICDFGLAALIESQDSLSLGSVRYMAPELLRGEPADERADVYSLGIIAYEMLIGRPHFDTAFRNVLRDQRNQAMRWMKWHTNARATAPMIDDFLPEVPTHLTLLVARMMDKDLSRRVGSARDIIDAIRRHFIGDGPDVHEQHAADDASPDASDSTSSQPGDTAALPTRSRLPLILAGLLVFWLVVGGVLLGVNESKKKAARERALTQAKTQINQGIGHYNAGRFDDALASYQLVIEGWPADSPQAQDAQLGVWKTQGRLAFNAKHYDQAVKHFEMYRDQGGNASSVEPLILEARDAEAFAQLTLSINQNIEDHAYPEARLTLKSARENKWSDAQSQQLDALDARIEQRRAEALAAQVIAEAKVLIENNDPAAAIAKLEELVSLPAHGQALLDTLRQDLAFDTAMAGGEDNLRSGQLGEAIESFNVAQALRPSDDLTNRISRLTARLLTREGAALLDAGELDAANDRFVKALQKDPENLDAKRLIKQIRSTTELTGIEGRGDAAAAAGDLAAATTAYQQAAEMAPDNLSIRTKLDNTRVRHNLQLARTAIDDQAFDRAQELLEAARLLAPQDSAVANLSATLDTQRAYRKLVAQGDAAKDVHDFGKAKRFYTEASKLVKGDEITQRLEEAQFQQYLTQAREYLDDGELDAARATLNLARDIRFTPELLSLIEAVDNARVGSEDGTTSSDENSP